MLYLATGYSTKAIAEELHIAESTVKAHVRHIYRKFDVHSKADLIAALEAQRGAAKGASN